MKLKKINAALGELSILCMLLHIAYSVFAYLTMYYNPLLKTVFMHKDGSSANLYPKQNMRTILQRISAALIFPLLILHLNTFSLMKASAEKGQTVFIILLIIAELLFFAVVITHVAVSFSSGFITLGFLTSEKTKNNIDRIMYIIGAAAFVISAFAVVKGQVIMFLS